MRPSVHAGSIPLPRARSWALSGAWARAVAAILAGAVVGGLVFLYLWQGCTLTLLRAERARYILELQELKRQRIHLLVQLQRETSPEAIARRARELGMCPFTPDRIIRLESEDDQGTGP